VQGSSLDEPLGALDALTRLEMHDLIEQLWKQHGFTALLVTHDVSEAIVLADRVIVIEEGKISLDLSVHLPRPRDKTSYAFTKLEAQLLASIIQKKRVEETPNVSMRALKPAA
jgi:sulfonate transport system ATP-binding protein